jgi:hypothetical protein
MVRRFSQSFMHGTVPTNCVRSPRISNDKPLGAIAQGLRSPRQHKLDTMRGMVSSGYTRGKISPERAASRKLDDWRDMSRGDADES